MSSAVDIVETGFGATVLAFGVVAGTAIYATGSLETLPNTLSAFRYALWMTFLPGFTLAAWPNVVAGVAAIGSARKLEEPLALRLAAFVAVYVFLTVIVHSSLAPV